MLVSEPNYARAVIAHLDSRLFVDPNNWEWKAESKAAWKPAEENWRQFHANWYGATESQSASLVDPKSPSLSLEPLRRGFDPSISSSIFIRESYVTMFDTVWAKAIARQGRHGVIITGQPGTGAHILPTSPIAYDQSCLKARHCSITISLFGFCSGNKLSSFLRMAKWYTSATILRSIQSAWRRLLLRVWAYHSLILSPPPRMSLFGRYLISASGKSQRTFWSPIRVFQCKQPHLIPSDTGPGTRKGFLCSPACLYGLAMSSCKRTSY
jgi:hypothetical protein